MHDSFMIAWKNNSRPQHVNTELVALICSQVPYCSLFAGVPRKFILKDIPVDVRIVNWAFV